jgi:hypothetical protein
VVYSREYDDSPSIRFGLRSLEQKPVLGYAALFITGEVFLCVVT